MIRSAAARVMSIGFSTTTCLPAVSAATAISACKPLGVQTVTASRSSRRRSASTSAVASGTPNLSASAAAFASSRSAIAINSTPSRPVRAWACTAPITPAPITANRSLSFVLICGLLFCRSAGSNGAYALGRRHPDNTWSLCAPCWFRRWTNAIGCHLLPSRIDRRHGAAIPVPGRSSCGSPDGQAARPNERGPRQAPTADGPQRVRSPRLAMPGWSGSANRSLIRKHRRNPSR